MVIKDVFGSLRTVSAIGEVVICFIPGVIFNVGSCTQEYGQKKRFPKGGQLKC